MPLARLTTTNGATGFGWSRGTPADAELLIGRSLGEVFSPECAVHESFRVFEYPLLDLLGLYPAGSFVRLSSGHIATVESSALSAPS